MLFHVVVLHCRIIPTCLRASLRRRVDRGKVVQQRGRVVVEEHQEAQHHLAGEGGQALGVPLVAGVVDCPCGYPAKVNGVRHRRVFRQLTMQQLGMERVRFPLA